MAGGLMAKGELTLSLGLGLAGGVVALVAVMAINWGSSYKEAAQADVLAHGRVTATRTSEACVLEGVCMTKHYARIRFNYAGSSHSFEAGSSADKGDRVAVRYDPDDPTNAFIASQRKPSARASAFFGGLAALPIAFGVWAWAWALVVRDRAPTPQRSVAAPARQSVHKGDPWSAKATLTLAPCPSCGLEVDERFRICPYCQATI